MARSKNPAPHAARSAADTATDPAPASAAPAAGGSPAAAVLAALSASPAGAAVAVIAAHAAISVAAARQALIAREGRRRHPPQGRSARVPVPEGARAPFPALGAARAARAVVGAPSSAWPSARARVRCDLASWARPGLPRRGACGAATGEGAGPGSLRALAWKVARAAPDEWRDMEDRWRQGWCNEAEAMANRRTWQIYDTVTDTDEARCSPSVMGAVAT